MKTSQVLLSQMAKSQFLRTCCFLIGASLALLIAGCGGAGGGGGSPSDAGSISQTINSATIHGVVTEYSVPTALIPGVTAYPTSVYVPADYAVTTDRLPVFYVTDGVPDVEESDLAFEFTDVCKILEQQNIRAIVVGLTGQNRSTDYLMPGATSFYDFVTTELMPFIEATYRIDVARRTLSGHSYGGLFVGFALTMDRPSRHYFANFIALDGSFWQQPDLMVSGNQALFDAYKGALPAIKVVLSSSTQGNASYVQSYFDTLSAFRFAGLDVTLIPPYQTDHFSMFDEAFADSVKEIIPILQ